jgi:hypothetical protein
MSSLGRITTIPTTFICASVPPAGLPPYFALRGRCTLHFAQCKGVCDPLPTTSLVVVVGAPSELLSINILGVWCGCLAFGPTRVHSQPLSFPLGAGPCFLAMALRIKGDLLWRRRLCWCPCLLKCCQLGCQCNNPLLG